MAWLDIDSSGYITKGRLAMNARKWTNGDNLGPGVGGGIVCCCLFCANLARDLMKGRWLTLATWAGGHVNCIGKRTHACRNSGRVMQDIPCWILTSCLCRIFYCALILHCHGEGQDHCTLT